MPQSAKQKEKRGRQASVEGFANEMIACGILMKRYGNASRVSLPLSSYDIIVARKVRGEHEDIIRIQSKTARKSVSFVGGSRGGVDRTYVSGVKTYVQSPKHSDCVMGVHLEKGKPELYFIPTLLIKRLNKKSIAIAKIRQLKDNYEVLEHCKDKTYVFRKAKQYGLLR